MLDAACELQLLPDGGSPAWLWSGLLPDSVPLPAVSSADSRLALEVSSNPWVDHLADGYELSLLTDLIKCLVLQILRPGTQESVYIVELSAQPWLSVAAKKQQQPVPAQPQGPGDPLRQKAPPPASGRQPGAAPETPHDHRCAPFVIFTGLVSHTQLAAVLQPQQARPQSAPPPQIVRMRGPGEQMKYFRNLFPAVVH